MRTLCDLIQHCLLKSRIFYILWYKNTFSRCFRSLQDGWVIIWIFGCGIWGTLNYCTFKMVTIKYSFSIFFIDFQFFFYPQGIVWRFGDWHCCASLWERLFEIFQYCRTEDLFVNILDFFHRPFVFSTYHLGHILVVNAVDSYLQKGSY